MTLSSKIAWDDTVLPFQLDRSDIRGRVVRLDGVLDRILDQHAYPDEIESLVAEMALLTAMIGQTIKLRWKLSLQVRGEGAVRLIATDYYAPKSDGAPGHIRAYARYDADALTRAPGFDQIGKGYFAIMLDQGPGTTPYQGITPIAGTSLAGCAETYFAQSEQLPTRFSLSYSTARADRRAGGVMLQHMPKSSIPKGEGGSGAGGLMDAADLLSGESEENWGRVNILLDTVEANELMGPRVQPTEMLVRLFHEERPRVFDAQPVEFGCSCSAERVRNSLSQYPPSELADMVTEAGVITADCQFCGAHYEIDPATLGQGAGNDDGGAA